MKAKSNYFKDNPEIAFHLKSEDKAEKLFAWLSPEDKEYLSISSASEYETTCLDLLETLGEFSGTELAGNADQVNREDIKLEDGKTIIPPTMTSNINQLKELGAHYLSVDKEWGGMEIPVLYELAGSEMIARACPSTLLNIGWYAAIAKVIHAFGSQEIKEKFIPPLVDGSMSGSMALTEPDVGSDLASMRTYGEEQEDGSWKIYGAKQFISNGGGGLSLVLAQNKKNATGLKSINLYVVPQFENGEQNYRVSKIEEKPGLHGSATCALNFDGSKGYLLGKNGEGFVYMLHLMNEARLAVGYQGIGLMESVYRLAKDYANERQSWGKAIAKHEMIAEKLYDMDVDIKAFRSLLYRCSFYVSMYESGEKKLERDKTLSSEDKQKIEKEILFYKRKAREWTPLIKWWAGERSYIMARESLQIHGGYGYTTEYKPEWWLRESLILSIYEGTSEIQALMCIKDTIKDVIRNPRRFAESFVALPVRILSEKDPLKKKHYRMKQMFHQALLKIFTKLVATNIKDTISENKSSDIIRMLKAIRNEATRFENISPALQHAARICEIKTYLALASSAIRDTQIDENRRYVAERILSRGLNRVQFLKSEIENDEESFLRSFHDSEHERAAAQEG